MRARLTIAASLLRRQAVPAEVPGCIRQRFEAFDGDTAGNPPQKVEKRGLELAMALAMRPKLLLLDEPMAGIGRKESESLIGVLRQLKGRFSMLLIEHDMNAVFALADRISVMTYGRILATGQPDTIRSNPQVVTAYLGEGLE